MATRDAERVAVENVNHPGSVRYVDAKRYAAVERAFSRILPKTSPGLTGDEIRERLPDVTGPRHPRKKGTDLFLDEGD